MLPGYFQPLYLKKFEIPKSYQVFSNFKKRVLNPAYKELKKKEIIILSMNSSNRKKVISLIFNFTHGGGEQLEQISFKRTFIFS